jgi:hypothetical protein
MPSELAIAYEALDLMGGDIDGALLPIIAEMLGIDDIDSMIRLMRLVITEEREKR